MIDISSVSLESDKVIMQAQDKKKKILHPNEQIAIAVPGEVYHPVSLNSSHSLSTLFALV